MIIQDKVRNTILREKLQGSPCCNRVWFNRISMLFIPISKSGYIKPDKYMYGFNQAQFWTCWTLISDMLDIYIQKQKPSKFLPSLYASVSFSLCLQNFKILNPQVIVCFPFQSRSIITALSLLNIALSSILLCYMCTIDLVVLSL